MCAHYYVPNPISISNVDIYMIYKSRGTWFMCDVYVLYLMNIVSFIGLFCKRDLCV